MSSSGGSGGRSSGSSRPIDGGDDTAGLQRRLVRTISSVWRSRARAWTIAAIVAGPLLGAGCDHEVATTKSGASSSQVVGRATTDVPNPRPVTPATTVADAAARPPPSRAAERRVEDLLAQMTLPEKVGQMTLADRAAITPEEV